MLVRSRIKPYLAFASVIILSVGAAYFWGLRSSMLKLEKEAEANIQKARNFDVLKDGFLKQKTECQEFLSQQEGNFNQFSYCQKFIEFIEQIQELK